MFNVNEIKSKIKLHLPLTPQEYAFAILFLGMDPKTYKQEEIKNEQRTTKSESEKTDKPNLKIQIEIKII